MPVMEQMTAEETAMREQWPHGTRVQIMAASCGWGTCVPGEIGVVSWDCDCYSDRLFNDQPILHLKIGDEIGNAGSRWCWVCYPSDIIKAWPLGSWQAREQDRVLKGDYTAVPAKCFADLPSLPPAEHFVHLSTVPGEPPDMIAYTMNAQKGEADIQLKIKLGRYLRKYWPDLPDTDIEQRVRVLKVAQHADTYTLSFTRDVEKINDIFETRMYACDSSADSCMYGKFANRTVRPYHVYADSPDVQVAYMTNSSDEIIARCVVNEKHKRWVRLYAVNRKHPLTGNDEGNQLYCEKLKALLIDAGYPSGDLTGAKLTLRHYHGDLTFPYLDGDGCCVDSEGRVNEHGEGEYHCKNVDGTYEPTDGAECYHCDECVREDDLNGVWGDRSVCDDCLSNHYTEASYIDNRGRTRTAYFPSDDVREACDGEMWHTDDLSYSDYTDSYHYSECECRTEATECSECGDDLPSDEEDNDLCRDCQEKADRVDEEEEEPTPNEGEEGNIQASLDIEEGTQPQPAPSPSPHLYTCAVCGIVGTTDAVYHARCTVCDADLCRIGHGCNGYAHFRYAGGTCGLR